MYMSFGLFVEQNVGLSRLDGLPRDLFVVRVGKVVPGIVATTCVCNIVSARDTSLVHHHSI